MYFHKYQKFTQCIKSVSSMIGLVFTTWCQKRFYRTRRVRYRSGDLSEDRTTMPSTMAHSGAISQISHKSVACLNPSNYSNHVILSKFFLVPFGIIGKEVCCCLRSSLCQFLPIFRNSLVNDAISCGQQRVFKTKRICDPPEFSQKCCMPASFSVKKLCDIWQI